MLKMSFWLEKSSSSKESLECITIDNPKKVLGDKMAGMYACEVYLPETEKKVHLIYANSPVEVLCFASDFAKVYLQMLINRGYTVREVESREV
jgi:hypothetical protein